MSCTATDARARSAQCSFQVTVDIVARLRGTKFLAFGDSITFGQVADPATAARILDYDPINNYPTVLLGMLLEQFPSQASSITVINAGRGGEPVVESEDRLVEEVTQASPDVLLLLHGANDVNNKTSPSLIGQSIRANIRRAQQRGVKLVLVATLVPQVEGRLRANNPEGVLDANDAIRDAAAREGAVLVDMFAAFDPLKERLIGDDGLHPTVEGYRLMAETFVGAIRANFEAPASAAADLVPGVVSRSLGLVWPRRPGAGGRHRVR